uniref:INO80 complex subunit B n=1 Tax=Cacopsylla melanoneura TaxID=428564 RepID=A0A8D9ALW9_9HEMI
MNTPGGSVPSTSTTTTPPSSSPSLKKKSKEKKKEDAASSDEERWLEAIESGNLEEVDDELKKIKPKDPKLMTARQRAMLERKTDNSSDQLLMSLPSGYREKVMTPEMAQKAALKSQKRKQQADEKREKDKQKTMERLLKKQESKSGKIISKKSAAKKQTPTVKLIQTRDSTLLAFPIDEEFPLKQTKIEDLPIPSPRKCGIPECTNMKKYSCSQTGIPLCSLECYKKVQSMKEYES